MSEWIIIYEENVEKIILDLMDVFAEEDFKTSYKYYKTKELIKAFLQDPGGYNHE